MVFFEKDFGFKWYVLYIFLSLILVMGKIFFVFFFKGVIIIGIICKWKNKSFLNFFEVIFFFMLVLVVEMKWILILMFLLFLRCVIFFFWIIFKSLFCNWIGILVILFKKIVFLLVFLKSFILGVVVFVNVFFWYLKSLFFNKCFGIVDMLIVIKGCLECCECWWMKWVKTFLFILFLFNSMILVFVFVIFKVCCLFFFNVFEMVKKLCLCGFFKGFFKGCFFWNFKIFLVW